MSNTKKNRGKLNKSFRKFIDHDEYFTEEEQQQILHSFENKYYQKVFRLSIYFLVWSIISFSIDSTFISGGVIASILAGVHIVYFLPTILFSFINYGIKFVYVRWYMKDTLTLKQAALVGIPCIGSALILRMLLKNDPLFLEGLRHYIKYLRRRGFAFILRLFQVSKRKRNI